MINCFSSIYPNVLCVYLSKCAVTVGSVVKRVCLSVRVKVHMYLGMSLGLDMYLECHVGFAFPLSLSPVLAGGPGQERGLWGGGLFPLLTGLQRDEDAIMKKIYLNIVCK